MSIDLLRRYLQNHFNSIDGWCWRYSFQPLEWLDRRQRELRAVGPIAEIGVYHGKFFIGLQALKADAYPSLALDVFDMQSFSMAGDGTRIRVPTEISSQQRANFESNLVKADVDLSHVRIIRCDSVAIAVRELLKEVPDLQKFTFFSVDGNHEATQTYHDINLSMELTSEYGLIFADDYLNARWPGVHEAIAKLYFGSFPKYVPLYYLYNKLALCHVNLHDDYFEGLRRFYKESHPSAHVRTVTRYGWRTLTIEPRNGLDVLVGFPDSMSAVD